MSEPTPLDELLGDVMARLGVARPHDSVTLLERWAELAPSPWSERTIPVALHDGRLEVEVADGATASLLRYQEAELIDRLAEALGAGLVSEVRLTVRRRRTQS